MAKQRRTFMNNRAYRLAAITFFVLLASCAHQTSDPNIVLRDGMPLEEVLILMKRDHALAQQENAVREDLFTKKSKATAENLARANDLKKEEEARSQHLEDQYAQNEIDISQKTLVLKARLNELERSDQCVVRDDNLWCHPNGANETLVFSGISRLDHLQE